MRQVKSLKLKVKSLLTVLCGFLFAVIFSATAFAETVGVTVSYNGFEIPDARVSMYDNSDTCTGSGITNSSGVAVFNIDTSGCDVNSTTFTIEASLSLADGTTQRGLGSGLSLAGGQDFYSFEVVLQAPSSASSSGGSGADTGTGGASSTGASVGNSSCPTSFRFFFSPTPAYAADSKVSGQVVGTNNKGVADVKVTAFKNGEQSVTDTTGTNGGFSVTIPTSFYNDSSGPLRQASVKLVAEKDGAQIGETTVTSFEDQTVSATISASIAGGGAVCVRPTSPGGANGTNANSSSGPALDLSQSFAGTSLSGGLVSFLKNSVQLKTVWRSMLILTNIVVVMILLAVAFATIFHIQVDTYGVKKVLPTLIVGVILANLSFLIVRNIIEFANVLSVTFIGSNPRGLVNDLSGAMIKGTFLQIADFLSRGVAGTATQGLAIAGIALATYLSAGTVLIAILLLVALLSLIPAILFVILAFLLYARTVILVFLTAISPLAFIAMAFAPTQGLFRQWWTQFLRWTFMAPAVFFFLWLAKEFSFFTGSNVSQDGSFAGYALSIIMLYLAIQVPFKLGGAVMSVYGGAGKRLTSYVGKTGFNYFQGLAERKGLQTPRTIKYIKEARAHEFEEEVTKVTAAKGQEKAFKLFGTGKYPILQRQKIAESGERFKQRREVVERANAHKKLSDLYDRNPEGFYKKIREDNFEDDAEREASLERLAKSTTAPAGLRAVLQDNSLAKAKDKERIAGWIRGLDENEIAKQQFKQRIDQTIVGILGAKKDNQGKPLLDGQGNPVLNKLSDFTGDDFKQKQAQIQKVLSHLSRDDINRKLSGETLANLENYVGKDWQKFLGEKVGGSESGEIGKIQIPGGFQFKISGVQARLESLSQISSPIKMELKNQVEAYVNAEDTKDALAAMIVKNTNLSEDSIKGIFVEDDPVGKVLSAMSQKGISQDDDSYKFVASQKQQISNILNNIRNSDVAKLAQESEIKDINEPEKATAAITSIETAKNLLLRDITPNSSDAEVAALRNQINNITAIPDSIKAKLTGINLKDTPEKEAFAQKLDAVHSALDAQKQLLEKKQS